MTPLTLVEFLTWLASSAGAAVAFSFVAERWPGWEALNASTKSWVTLGGSLGIGLLSFFVLKFTPPDTLAALVPLFQVIYGVVASWIANQIGHKADPANKPKDDSE